VPTRTPDNQDDTWKGESGRYINETAADERDISLESKLVEFNWDRYFDMIGEGTG